MVRNAACKILKTVDPRGLTTRKTLMLFGRIAEGSPEASDCDVRIAGE